MTKVAHLKYDVCGVGNRIFQYAYARLWCEDNGYELSHTGIPELEIPANEINFKGLLLNKPQRFLQDYNLYRDHLERVKEWECFDDIEETNEEDLVIHLRAGNRFLGINSRYSASAEEWKKTLDTIEFKRLHVVTNLSKHTEWSLGDIKEAINKLKSKGGDGEPSEIYQKEYPFLPIEESLEITNSFIEMLNNYDIVWVNNSIKEDFNYLRKFKKIMFPRSTFSWWAAATGVADEVYVYGPWAPHKARTSGWLGETNYKGWKSWK